MISLLPGTNPRIPSIQMEKCERFPNLKRGIRSLSPEMNVNTAVKCTTAAPLHVQGKVKGR